MSSVVMIKTLPHSRRLALGMPFGGWCFFWHQDRCIAPMATLSYLVFAPIAIAWRLVLTSAISMAFCVANIKQGREMPLATSGRTASTTKLAGCSQSSIDIGKQCVTKHVKHLRILIWSAWSFLGGFGCTIRLLLRLTPMYLTWPHCLQDRMIKSIAAEGLGNECISSLSSVRSSHARTSTGSRHGGEH